MKISSISFSKPVKIRGNMVHTLTSTVAVGRLGEARAVNIDFDEGKKLVKIFDLNKLIVIIPLGNVDFMIPADEEPAAPATSSKK